MHYEIHPTSVPRPIQFLPLAVLLFALAASALVTKRLRLLPTVSAPSAETRQLEPGLGALSPAFAPSVSHWSKSIAAWSAEWELDPNLVATVMQIESCGDPQAVSGAGAQGLFQVMPFHFAPDEIMLDPDTNARRGLRYLAQGLALANGDVRLALAGYNGGHSQITNNPEFWPAETQRYVYWGTGIYADVVAGDQVSPTLVAWLAAGGESLCAQARQRLGL